jgi:hypothetical protein
MDTHLTSIILFVSQNSTYSEEMNSLHSEYVCVDVVWRPRKMVKDKETRNAVSLTPVHCHRRSGLSLSRDTGLISTMNVH